MIVQIPQEQLLSLRPAANAGQVHFLPAAKLRRSMDHIWPSVRPLGIVLEAREAWQHTGCPEFSVTTLTAHISALG